MNTVVLVLIVIFFAIALIVIWDEISYRRRQD
jgi:hypothetical protein